MSIFRKIGHRNNKRRFGAWQIEITTRCSLRCTMCIKTACQQYHRKDMDLQDFEKIVPYLHDVKSVVLEGWGESLLHKNLVDIIRLAKSAGPEVGFVTSGMELNNEYACKIVEAGVDFMGFSLSGATPETHNAIRVNSNFATIIEAIKTVKRLSTQSLSGRPKLHIVYLMLKDNMHEIPGLLDVAEGVGVKEVVLLNIIQVTNKDQDSQKAFSCEEGSLYKNILRKAEDKAKKLKTILAMPSVYPQDVAVCSENPLDNMYISVDGKVSPCVYLYPPVPSPFTRVFCGAEGSMDHVSFGNIFNEPFDHIQEKEQYREFCEAFQSRQKKWKEAYASLIEMRRPENAPLPLPPAPCRTCHKMLGF